MIRDEGGIIKLVVIILLFLFVFGCDEDNPVNIDSPPAIIIEAYLKDNIWSIW